MMKWFLKNKLFGVTAVAASVFFIAFGIQTWRVSSLKSDAQYYKDALASYEQTLEEVKDNAIKREDALLQDFARERRDNEKKLQTIKNTARYENQPLPDGILDIIDELYSHASED